MNIKTFSYTNVRPVWQVIAAGVLFVVTTLTAQQHWMPSLEEPLFYAIYGWPSFLFVPFLVITQFGSVYMLGGLLLLYGMQRQYHRFLRVLMAGTLAYVLAGFAKDLWGRARPEELFSEVVALDLFTRGPGFPSGHVALATALALVVGHYLPKRFHWVIAAWIIGVALSRIYLGVHAPLDLVGGFAVGWFSYALFRNVRMYDNTFARKNRSVTAKRRQAVDKK